MARKKKSDDDGERHLGVADHTVLEARTEYRAECEAAGVSPDVAQEASRVAAALAEKATAEDVLRSGYYDTLSLEQKLEAVRRAILEV